MTFVSIPGGEFVMGCSPDDEICYSDFDKPQHKVKISPFKMSAYEVTQGQWEKVMGVNPSYHSENGGGVTCGSDCPVEQVSWDDIQLFIDKLNEDTQKSYRLPTEAEWEYAVRAGTTTRYYCGDDDCFDEAWNPIPCCLDDIAWHGLNSGLSTHPKGQKNPNKWGLYDMSGNVSEWVQDWFKEDYYSESPDTDPQGPDTGLRRVVRGGAWGNYANDCLSSSRTALVPTGIPHSFYGFRLVLP
jgi:formylglycine-generating enzyme required for sulfatase activity